MDKLQSILAKSKPQAKIIIKKQQLEKKNQEAIQKRIKQKQKQSQAKTKRLQQLEEFYSGKQTYKKQKLDEPSKNALLTQQQVKAQLQKLFQQPSLPNQTEQARYRRYLRIKKIHEQDPKVDLKTLDEQFYNKMKQKQFIQALESKYRDMLIQPKLGDDPVFRQKKIKIIENEKDKDFYTQENFAQVCDQTYLCLFKIMKQWKQKLQQKYNTEQLRSNSVNMRMYRDTLHEMQSFFTVLKNRKGDKGMIVSVYHIVNCCLVRQYVQANDKYIQLSIGNAPWPMGVAMLSITVKKNALKLTHVLNDQMTRKWMQGVKRLITVSQELFPNQDSLKMFHTSANSIL